MKYAVFKQNSNTLCNYILSVGLKLSTSQPIMRELNKVKVTNWYNLGLELYVEDAELETIRQNNPRDQDNCKREMFRKWLSICPQASYRQLAHALVSVGDVSEADRLCKNHGEECRHDISE